MPEAAPVGLPPAISDVGGLATGDGRTLRRGRAFRVSGSLLGDEDVAQLGALGVTRVVDLRAPAEARPGFPALLRRHDIEHLPVPIDMATPAQLVAFVADPVAATAFVEQAYRAVLTAHGAALARAVAAVAAPRPVAFGCAAGKDRAGLVAAVLQTALGVPIPVVVEEYVRCAPDPAALRPIVLPLLPGGVAGGGLDVVLAAHPELLKTLLEELQALPGGVPAYLGRNGLGQEGLDAVRRTMLGDGRGGTR